MDGFADNVANMVAKEGKITLHNSVVSSQFDADRLDYMQRDRLMSGSKHSAVDQEVPMLGVFSGFDSFTGNLRFCWLSVAHTVMQVSWTSGQTYSRAPRTDFIPAMCPCALLVLMSAYAGTG